MGSDTIRRLLASGLLEPDFADELCEDYYAEYFGGRYEELEASPLTVHFPKVRGDEVAWFYANASSESAEWNSLEKLLKAFEFRCRDVCAGVDFATVVPDLQQFEAVTHEFTKSVNYMGEKCGLLWSFHLDRDGSLLALQANDIPLIVANSEMPRCEPEEVRDSLRQLLIHALRR